MGGRSSQLHIWVRQQILTNLSSFLFLFLSPQLHLGVLGSIEKRYIFYPNVKLGRRGDKKEEKERGKKLLKFVTRPKREVERIVLPSSQLHARLIKYLYKLMHRKNPIHLFFLIGVGNDLWAKKSQKIVLGCVSFIHDCINAFLWEQTFFLSKIGGIVLLYPIPIMRPIKEIS